MQTTSIELNGCDTRSDTHSRIDPTLMDRLTKLIEKCPTKVCELHRHTSAVNRTLTFQNAAQVLEDRRPIYDPCPRCEELMVIRRHRMQAGRGIPALFFDAHFDQLTVECERDRKNIERCRAFAASPDGFLVLLGGVGLAKTHLAASIIIEHGREGLLISQNDLLIQMRETYRNSKAPDPVERCKAASLLALDELGVSLGGKDEYPALHSILNHRYEWFMPTVITSNLSEADFKNLLGERLIDRIRQATSEAGVLTFAGSSKRAACNGDYLTRAKEARDLRATRNLTPGAYQGKERFSDCEEKLALGDRSF